jgi:hypothetical protein
MVYRTFLILFIICIGGLQPAFAENNRYRVEILVLSHLGHGQQGRETRKLEDFSSAIDFLQPTEEEEGAAEAPGEAESELLRTTGADTFGAGQALVDADPAALEAEALNAVVHVEEMGPEMQDAWRRLRLSGPFRPLQYLAWEQGSNPPFPTLRVHDSEAVLIEDPWAEQRLLQESTEMPLPGSAEPAIGSDVGAFEVPAPGADGDEQTLPDPIVYYRLDGTAKLTRSRFLHLAFAIEWREPEFAPAQAVATTPPTALNTADEAPVGQVPARFLVHRLEQSRPIRSGRMEYFDGPVLGVLAWVSDVTEPVAPKPID